MSKDCGPQTLVSYRASDVHTLASAALVALEEYVRNHRKQVDERVTKLIRGIIVAKSEPFWRRRGREMAAFREAKEFLGGLVYDWWERTYSVPYPQALDRLQDEEWGASDRRRLKHLINVCTNTDPERILVDHRDQMLLLKKFTPIVH